MGKATLPLAIFFGLLLGPSLYGQYYTAGSLYAGSITVSNISYSGGTLTQTATGVAPLGSGNLVILDNTLVTATTVTSGTVSLGNANTVPSATTGLVKQGTGTLTLTGSNATFGGPTTISSGTLSLANSGIIGNGSPVSNSALQSNVPVPEPSSLALLTLGLGGILAFRHRGKWRA